MPDGALAVSFGDDRATIRETLARVEGRPIASDTLAPRRRGHSRRSVDPGRGRQPAGADGDETPPRRRSPRSRARNRSAATGRSRRTSARARPGDADPAGRRAARRPGPEDGRVRHRGPGRDGPSHDAPPSRGFVQTAETEAARSRATIYVLGLSNAGQPVELDRTRTAERRDRRRAGARRPQRRPGARSDRLRAVVDRTTSKSKAPPPTATRGARRSG